MLCPRFSACAHWHGLFAVTNQLSFADLFLQGEELRVLTTRGCGSRFRDRKKVKKTENHPEKTIKKPMFSPRFATSSEECQNCVVIVLVQW